MSIDPRHLPIFQARLLTPAEKTSCIISHCLCWNLHLLNPSSTCLYNVLFPFHHLLVQGEETEAWTEVNVCMGSRIRSKCGNLLKCGNLIYYTSMSPKTFNCQQLCDNIMVGTWNLKSGPQRTYKQINISF